MNTSQSGITLLQLKSHIDRMLLDNPESAGLEVRTITHLDDDYTRVLGTPSEANVDEFFCVRWSGGAEQQEEYEKDTDIDSPVNAVLL